MLLDGKRPGRRKIQTQLKSLPAGGFMTYLRDQLTNRAFLVDTGASRSVFPHNSTAPSTGPRLLMADGSPIRSWGDRNLPLKFGNRRFNYQFLLADVDRPILGADFLGEYDLVVDPATRQVLQKPSYQPLARPIATTASPNLSSVYRLAPDISQLLDEFPEVFQTQPPGNKPLHGVKHEIETEGRPLHARPRLLDQLKLQAAEEEFRKLESAGIIRRSDSPWASPLHIVPKQDGSLRPCGDYRRLNNVTRPDRYPLPNLQDFTKNLRGCTVFSKIDLKKGYYQIPMKTADIPKTAIITPFGLFEFLCMPFGLKNAAQTFQRMMDRIFRGLPFAFVYLDDILIASSNRQTHIKHLRSILKLLLKNGLVINSDKCEFARSSVDYLGHHISASGIVPIPRNVAALQDMPPPRDIKGLQRFLGMINFYRRFLPRIAQTLRPLTDALAGNPKTLTWNSQQQDAFLSAKSALAKAVTLVHPSPTRPISLVTDASSCHVGAVLQQQEGQSWRPLAFYSAKLSTTQQKYSAFDRELLAVYMALRHFRFELEGRVFHVLTDHKPLVSALHRVTPPWSARQQRQLSFIAEFTSDIRHTPGSSNVVADTLSRPEPVPPPQEKVEGAVSTSPELHHPSLSSHVKILQVEGAASTVSKPTRPSLPLVPQFSATGIDFITMAKEQTSCTDIHLLQQSPTLNIASVPVGDVMLLCDTRTKVLRPLVPASHRHQVFTALHQISHPGTRATIRLISSRYVWKGMSSDIRSWCRTCDQCQRGKILRHVHVRPEVMQIPSRRFSHIHVDLVGPLPVSHGYSYILTVMDRSTRWPEAIPLTNISASECASALFHGWIARFGVPALLTSDRGTQFTSSLWAAICTLLGIQHKPTTAFHPQSNGMVERFHRQLKDALRSRLATSDWYHHLPWVLLGLRSAPRQDSATTAADAVYGSSLVLPNQFLQAPEPPCQQFYEDLREAMSGFQPINPRHNTSAAAQQPEQLPAELLNCKFVYIRKDGHVTPLSPLYEGPYEVLRRSLRTFRIKIGNREDTVSVQRLKPAHAQGEHVPAQPRPRGRPKRPQQQQYSTPRRRGRPPRTSTTTTGPPRRGRSPLVPIIKTTTPTSPVRKRLRFNLAPDYVPLRSGLRPPR